MIHFNFWNSALFRQNHPTRNYRVINCFPVRGAMCCFLVTSPWLFGLRLRSICLLSTDRFQNIALRTAWWVDCWINRQATRISPLTSNVVSNDSSYANRFWKSVTPLLLIHMMILTICRVSVFFEIFKISQGDSKSHKYTYFLLGGWFRINLGGYWSIFSLLANRTGATVSLIIKN